MDDIRSLKGDFSLPQRNQFPGLRMESFILHYLRYYNCMVQDKRSRTFTTSGQELRGMLLHSSVQGQVYMHQVKSILQIFLIWWAAKLMIIGLVFDKQKEVWHNHYLSLICHFYAFYSEDNWPFVKTMIYYHNLPGLNPGLPHCRQTL